MEPEPQETLRNCDPVQPASDAYGRLKGNPWGNHCHAWERALGAALEATADDLAATLTLPDDVVEAALADAVQRAAAAGQWASVEALARQLEVRRRARAGVVELDAARAKRRAK